MAFRTLRRKNSNWQAHDENHRKRTLDYVESVQAQSLELSHYEDESDGIVNQLYTSIVQFCQNVLFNLQNSEEALRREPMSTPLYRLLDDIYTSFITWGNDLDVRRGTLDNALKDSRELRQLTIKIMIRICEAIENEIHPTMLDIFKETQLESPIQRLETKLKRIRSIKAEAILHAQNSADSDYDDSTKSASSSDGYDPDAPSDSSSLEEALETLKDEVEALIDLTPSLEDPVPDTIVDTHEKAATPQAQGSNLNHEDCKYLTFLDGIKQKSPQCNDALATAIGKAIYRTTIRLQAERDAAANHQSSLGVDRPEKAASELFPRDSGYDTATRDPSQQLNNLPAQPTTSLGSGRDTNYAQTLNAYKDDDGTISTPFPSQPKEVKIGDKFACVACGRQVAKSQSGAAWRRHVLSDLQPWICCQISCDCNFKSFSTRDEWLKHLQAIHEAHPSWNATSCPFCPQEVTGGHRNMMRHVERHLRQLSLAALPASHEDGSEDSESESEKDIAGAEPETIEIMGSTTQPTKPPGNTTSVGRLETPLWDHPVYKNATQEADGLWHCPWEGEGYCQHKPSVLKADHDKFIEYHLKSLWCKIDGCPSNNNQPFATQEILYLHELKYHGMHKGGGRFLCTSPGCGRSRQGNGFMNPWLQLEHIKNVHDNLPDIGLPEGP